MSREIQENPGDEGYTDRGGVVLADRDASL